LGRLRALLERVARWVLGNRKLVLGTATLLTIVSPAWILGIQVHADTAALVPRGDPVVAAYRTFADRFGEPNELLVRLPAQGFDRASLDSWTEDLAAEIRAWPEVSSVRATKLPVDPAEAAWQIRATLLNGGERGRSALLAMLDAEELRRAALRTRRRVLTVGDPEARRAATTDPLGILELVAEAAAETQPPLTLSDSSGYLDSVDGVSRLLIVQPTGSAEDGAYCRDLMRRIRRSADELAKDAGFGEITIELAGLHAMTGESMEIVMRDLSLITLVAVAGLFLVLWACFGSWHWVLLIFSPLIVAQAVYLGVVRLVFGPINYLSIGFAAVVLGLGLDFGLHLAARFDQRRGRLATEEAIVAVMAEAGPPIVVAAFTTAAAFACLSLSTIPFLRQFGWLTSLGLLVMLLVTLLIFPALAASAPPRSGLSLRRAFRSTGRAAAEVLSARAGIFAMIALGLAVASIFWARGFRFDMDLMRLFPSGLAAAETELDLRNEFGGIFGTPLLLTLSGPDLDTVLARQAELDLWLTDARDSGSVVGFVSPSAWFVRPSMDLTAAEWAALEEGAPAGVEHLRGAFVDAGLRWSEQMQRYGELLAAVANRQAPLRVASDLAEAPETVRRLLSFGDDRSGTEGNAFVGTRVLVTNANRQQVDAESAHRLVEELHEFRAATGMPLEIAAITKVYSQLNQSIRGEFFRLSGIALGVVLLITLLFLRDLRLALTCFVPLLAAVPATLALAGLGGIRLAPTTVGFAAVVIGIGIDDAIHLVVRRVDNPRMPVVSILEEILPVITLTTVSTAFGFGALTISALEPTRSIGMITASGVVFAWLFSWLLLPRLLRRRPDDLRSEGGGGGATGSSGGRSIRRPAAIVLILLLSSSPLTAAHQSLTTEQLLEEIRNSLDSMDAVTSELRQRISYEQLTGEVELEGSLFFQKPNLFRLELGGQQNLRVLSDGELVWLVDLDLDEVETWSVEDIEATARLSRLFPLLNVFTPEDLGREFEVVSVVAEHGEHRLSLIPRESTHSMAQMIVELDGRFRPLWTRVEYTNGDSLEIEFEGWRRREPVSIHFFQHLGEPGRENVSR
jgi:predicted RND superfamily exporter protein/outer membrane lipoprotein-sorting protein